MYTPFKIELTVIINWQNLVILTDVIVIFLKASFD